MSDVDRGHTETDVLKDIFKKRSLERLPLNFEATLMQKINLEASRVQKRNQRLYLWGLVFATFLTIGISVGAFFYLKISPASFVMPEITIPPLYLFIGLAALILLFGDYFMRQLHFKKTHK